MRRWSDNDVDILMERVGSVGVDVIADSLGRSPAAVRIKASRLGLSVSVQPPVWCPRCATWRMRLDSNGRCPVCRMKALANAMEERWRDMTGPEGISEGLAPSTSRRPPLAVIRAEEAAAVERHRARYNAAKMRLSRARRRDG